MGLLSSNSKKSSTTANVAQDASLENNQGAVNIGDGTIEYVDHGAVTGSLASNAAISQSALLANVTATGAALDANTEVSKMAFDFGSDALDANNYTTGLAFENSASALDTVSGFGASVIDKFNDLTTSVLVNGEKATRGALELAKTSTQSEAANITELMMKAGMILGVVAIIGAVVARGRK